jgi:hypothetical protein
MWLNEVEARCFGEHCHWREKLPVCVLLHRGQVVDAFTWKGCTGGDESNEATFSKCLQQISFPTHCHKGLPKRAVPVPWVSSGASAT